MQKKKKILKNIPLSGKIEGSNIVDKNSKHDKNLLEKNLDKYISMLIENNLNELENYEFSNEFDQFFEFNSGVSDLKTSKCEMNIIPDENLSLESYCGHEILKPLNHDYDHEFDDENSSTSDLDSDLSNEKYDQLMDNITNMKFTFKNLINKIDENLIQKFNNEDVDSIKSNYSIQVPQNENNFSFPTQNLTPDNLDKTPSFGFPEELRYIEDKSEITSDVFSQINDPCSILENFGVILVKWPENIRQLWEEYTNIPDHWSNEYQLNFQKTISKLKETNEFTMDLSLILQRNTSIRQLETLFGSSWRSKDKNFSRQVNRRKKIWSVIEDGLRDGLELEKCIDCLESYAYRNNSSISSLYKGVPFRIIDMIDK